MIEDKGSPKITILTITYGHEDFIKETLNGILMQTYNGPVEFIIANDNSPDNTDHVIKDYFNETFIPANFEIKYTKHENNIGMMPNFIWALKQASGKYIALCEGDDYWTESDKLQKQVNFLENNQEYVLTFHPIKILKTNGELVDDFITTVPQNYENQETLARLGNYIHTPSVVFRNIVQTFPREFIISPIGDYFLYMILTANGKVKMLAETMAVYRHGVGVLSAQSNLKRAKSFLTFYTLLLSWSNNPILNEILLKRQEYFTTNVEKIVRSEYTGVFISNHFFYRALSALQQPKTLWNKIKIRF
ncbi:glycosyltransferase family 2 protein [Chryseobacterium sp. MP_3.2]|uniref:glycosyltransferase family 2 protein n=1 Tax=Chryseobacterium sp. MP_3.2 TaxID=3071712 RepID=UPI002E0CA40E|nr:glycosyltransferase involved in cell wall biosynthesis [Chryseobacterium sp. MP_3.2]